MATVIGAPQFNSTEVEQEQKHCTLSYCYNGNEMTNRRRQGRKTKFSKCLTVVMDMKKLTDGDGGRIASNK